MTDFAKRKNSEPNDEKNFITATAEQYKGQSSKQAQSIPEQVAALSGNSNLSETNQIAFLIEIFFYFNSLPAPAENDSHERFSIL